MSEWTATTIQTTTSHNQVYSIVGTGHKLADKLQPPSESFKSHLNLEKGADIREILIQNRKNPQIKKRK